MLTWTKILPFSFAGGPTVHLSLGIRLSYGSSLHAVGNVFSEDVGSLVSLSLYRIMPVLLSGFEGKVLQWSAGIVRNQ